MFGELDELFELSKQRIDYYKNTIEKIEDNPELILTDMYIENTHQNLLSFLINDIDENSLIEFQSYLYRILIPYLKSKLNIDGLDFHFTPHVFPTPLNVIYNEGTIAEINIYEKIILMKESEMLIRVNDYMKDLIQYKEKLEKELSELQLNKIEPLSLGGGNPLKIVNIVLRKDKIKNDLDKSISEINNKLSEIQKELISLNISIENIKQEYVEAEYYQEKLERRFKNIYNYQIKFEKDYI